MTNSDQNLGRTPTLNLGVRMDRAADNTIKLTITVPWKQVETARAEVEEELMKQLELPGFRKGHVPQNIAKEKLPREKVREELLKKVLTETYMEAVKKERLNPIMSPQVHVEAFDEGTPLTYTAETCELPKVTLGRYKDEIAKVTAKSKIAVPGKEPEKPSMDEMIKAAMNVIEIQIPKIMVQQEATRLLSQLLDELKQLGMTLDQYLASRGKTGDQLKEEYEAKAAQDLKLEFFLRAVADEEKIAVEQADVEAALKEVTDQKQREAIAQNPYLVAAIIRQQKTLDFLAKL